MGSRGDSSMQSVVTSSNRVSPDKARVSPRRVAPTVAGTVARVESLRGMMPEARGKSRECLSPCWQRASTAVNRKKIRCDLAGRMEII